jgi:hypothetical protein
MLSAATRAPAIAIRGPLAIGSRDPCHAHELSRITRNDVGDDKVSKYTHPDHRKKKKKKKKEKKRNLASVRAAQFRAVVSGLICPD